MTTHITTGSAINLATSKVRKVHVTVNAALTGTITISDETGTSGSPVIAIITNPTVGTSYDYYDFTKGVCVTPSTTCEISVSVSSSFGPW